VGRLTTMNGFKACPGQADPIASCAPVRLQLVLGRDRAEVSLHNLERLENRPLCQELAVVLRALTVVAATGILGWKATDGIPPPAAGRCGIAVDRGGELVVATVAYVAKAVEMSILGPGTRCPIAREPSSGPRTVAGRPCERCLIR
jgi:hypothetical protein